MGSPGTSEAADKKEMVTKKPTLIQLFLEKTVVTDQVTAIEQQLKTGCNINEEDVEGRSLLHYVAENGSPETMKFLLGNVQLDLFHVDKAGNTALMVACRSGQREIVDFIINTLLIAADDEQYKAFLNRTNRDGETVYSIANQKRLNFGFLRPGTNESERVEAMVNPHLYPVNHARCKTVPSPKNPSKATNATPVTATTTLNKAKRFAKSTEHIFPEISKATLTLNIPDGSYPAKEERTQKETRKSVCGSSRSEVESYIDVNFEESSVGGRRRIVHTLQCEKQNVEGKDKVQRVFQVSTTGRPAVRHRISDKLRRIFGRREARNSSVRRAESEMDVSQLWQSECDQVDSTLDINNYYVNPHHSLSPTPNLRLAPPISTSTSVDIPSTNADKLYPPRQSLVDATDKYLTIGTSSRHSSPALTFPEIRSTLSSSDSSTATVKLPPIEKGRRKRESLGKQDSKAQILWSREMDRVCH